jgi:uncharacterized protein YaaQ
MSQIKDHNMAKKTVFAADEHLIVYGDFTVQGNTVFLNTTETQNQSDQYIINSDADASTSLLRLRAAGAANIDLVHSGGNLVVRPGIQGNVYIPSGNALVVDGALIGSGLSNTTVASAITLPTPRQFSISGDVSAAGINFDGSSDVALVATIQKDSTITLQGAVAGSGTMTNLGNTTITTTVDDLGIDYVRDVIAANGLTKTGSLGAAQNVSISVGAGDGISVSSDAVAVNSTVVRTSGNQTIAGEKTFTDQITLSADIIPSVANIYSIGSTTHHIGDIFANVVHAEKLDLGDADLSDIHATFYAGTPTGTLISEHESIAGGLIYQHKAPGQTGSGGYYRVNPGAGLEISGNAVAVNSTVVRTNTNQTLSGDKTFTGIVDLTGAVATVTTAAQGNSSTRIASTQYVDTAISNLLNGAPNQLDTLNELAAALADDENFASNVNLALAGKVDTTLTITTGDGLTGGGDLSTSRTFAVDGTVARTDVVFTAGDGLSGGGNLSASRTFAVDSTVARSNVTLTAGDGLTGGGDISQNRSFAVDSTVVRTTGDQSIGGRKTFTSELVIPQNETTTEGVIYRNNTAIYAYVGGQKLELTPSSDVGEVEDVGASGIDILAGARVVTVGNANVTYHGIRSIDVADGLSIAEASNVITITGRSDSNVRNLFSVTNSSGYGNISYSAANGVITYAGISNSEIRGLFSGVGLIGYNPSTGVFSTSADNYDRWRYRTDTAATEEVTSLDQIEFRGGDGINVTHSGNVITVASSDGGDITSVTAGAGLTGGGITGAVTLNVGAGNGITVAADEVAVNMSVFDTGDLAEGANLYYTDARARGAVSATGDLSYNPTTGVFSFSETYSTANELLAAIKTVDGPSSGLEAENSDKLDGQHGAFYQNASNLNSGTLASARLPDLTVADFAGAAIQTSAEAFGDVDTALMTAAAIDDRILSYGYTTNVGDITGVGAGAGLTGGGASGSVTLNIGAGTGITVNADNVAVDMSAFSTTNLSEGTNLYYTTSRANSAIDARVNKAFVDALNVDADTLDGIDSSAFLRSNANDTASGNLTFTGLNRFDDTAIFGDSTIDIEIIGRASVGFGILGTDTDHDLVLRRNNLERLRLTATGVDISGVLSDDGNRVLTVADEGTLDAGTLDSLNSDQFLRSDASDTMSGSLTVTGFVRTDELRCSNSQQLVLNAGESFNQATGQTGEAIYLNAESGLQINSSPDNWATGWATRNTATICDANGDSSFPGNVTVGGVMNGTATSAQYADLAENYVADADYEPGTVLVFGGEQEVTVTTQSLDHRVAGVVSTQPAHLMNAMCEGEHVVPVALRGRVPVKVTGTVRPGDLLATSTRAGYARAVSPKEARGFEVFAKAISHSENGWAEAVIL